MSTRRFTHTRANGFTLIEVVIALGILALILVTGYTIVGSMGRSKLFLDDIRDAQSTANAILTRMVRELQLATKTASLPPPCDDLRVRYPANLNFRGVSRRGDEQQSLDSITFLAREGGQYLPDGGGHSGVVQISYRIEPTPADDVTALGPLTLVREEVPLIRPPERACRQSMVFPLTSAVVSMQFSYYDNQRSEWTTDWDQPNRDGLPDMIRLQIGLRSPSGKITTYTTAVALRS